MYTKIEYVWLDGYKPEPNLRSKIKITNNVIDNINEVPIWGFDGSSTMQAEGFSSDCYLKPVRLYTHSFIKSTIKTIYAFCEVVNKDGKPHETNDRSKLGNEDENIWIGFEQEYFIRTGHHKQILGFDRGGVVDPQGKYYCGVGGQMVGRELIEEHLEYCLSLGISVEGINAEVALGQWEYQIFSKGKVKAGDDLWMSRYILEKFAEKRGYAIELHPKPLVIGDWNGSGLHTNFSNEIMREVGGQEYFKAIFNTFESRAKTHIDSYGSNNNLRLTGTHETQSIDKFSWGIGDRGASIRVPKIVGEEWKGYLEDRRPASNGNPYKIIKVIDDSLNIANQLKMALHNMYDNVNVNDIEKKYNTLSNDELLNQYKDDEDYHVEGSHTDSTSNVK